MLALITVALNLFADAYVASVNAGSAGVQRRRRCAVDGEAGGAPLAPNTAPGAGRGRVVSSTVDTHESAQRRSLTKRRHRATRVLRLSSRPSTCASRPPRVDAIIGDVGFALGRGEILGVVGESGSGKTTTTMALLGMAHPGAKLARGHVDAADGRSIEVTDAKTVADVARAVPELRAAVAGHRVEPGDARAGGAARDVAQLPGLRAGPPKGEWDSRLSTTCSARSACRTRATSCAASRTSSPAGSSSACASRCRCCPAPTCLILDEPTTGLDVITQASVLEELERLRTELGLSMLYISSRPRRRLAGRGPGAGHVPRRDRRERPHARHPLHDRSTSTRSGCSPRRSTIASRWRPRWSSSRAPVTAQRRPPGGCRCQRTTTR